MCVFEYLTDVLLCVCIYVYAHNRSLRSGKCKSSYMLYLKITLSLQVGFGHFHLRIEEEMRAELRLMRKCEKQLRSTRREGSRRAPTLWKIFSKWP